VAPAGGDGSGGARRADPRLRARAREGVGNFWVDLVRGTVHLLLPLSFVLALALASQGVVQTFAAQVRVPLLEPTVDADGAPVTEQVLAVGPAASQVAIKQLGTNGGGFYNVNSAHPFENPTPLSNFLETLAILLIPAALLLHLRRDGARPPPGRALYATMLAVFLPLLVLCTAAEQAGNPALAALGADRWPPPARSRPAATWRARRSASASRSRRSGPRRRRPPRTAR
jgi:potassium-transporting ATPase potassium-binding subunit